MYEQLSNNDLLRLIEGLQKDSTLLPWAKKSSIQAVMDELNRRPTVIRPTVTVMEPEAGSLGKFQAPPKKYVDIDVQARPVTSKVKQLVGEITQARDQSFNNIARPQRTGTFNRLLTGGVDEAIPVSIDDIFARGNRSSSYADQISDGLNKIKSPSKVASSGMKSLPPANFVEELTSSVIKEAKLPTPGLFEKAIFVEAPSVPTSSVVPEVRFPRTDSPFPGLTTPPAPVAPTSVASVPASSVVPEVRFPRTDSPFPGLITPPTSVTPTSVTPTSVTTSTFVPPTSPVGKRSATEEIAAMLGDLRREKIPVTMPPSSPLGSVSTYGTGFPGAVSEVKIPGFGIIPDIPPGSRMHSATGPVGTYGEWVKPTPAGLDPLKVAATTPPPYKGTGSMYSFSDDIFSSRGAYDPFSLTPAGLDPVDETLSLLAGSKKVASSADEAGKLGLWAKNAAKNVGKAKPWATGLATLGVLADVGFGAYDAYTADPYQSDEAKLAEALGAGVGAGGGGWLGGVGGASAGTALGTTIGALVGGPLAPLAAPVGGLIGTVAGSLLGAKVGKGLGQGVGELAVGGFDMDDGRKANIKKLKQEAIQDQIEEMKMIAAAQQEIERENAIFNQALAQQGLLDQTLMQMMMSGANNTGAMNAAQMINAIYG